jgi:hypothetical protein
MIGQFEMKDVFVCLHFFSFCDFGFHCDANISALSPVLNLRINFIAMLQNVHL